VKKISDDPACFVVSLKEVKKYGLIERHIGDFLNVKDYIESHCA